MRYGNSTSTNNYWLTQLFYRIGELSASFANCLASALGFRAFFRYPADEFP